MGQPNLMCNYTEATRRFIVNELEQRDLQPWQPIYKKLLNECLEASDILSRKELMQLINDHLELEGI